MSKLFSPQTSQDHLQNLLKILDIDLVLDVGANRGQFARQLRMNGYNGEIYSFEPVASTFQALLAATNNDDRWTAFPLAFGREPAEQDITITKNSAYTSFFLANGTGRGYFKANVSEEKKEKVKVLRASLKIEVLLRGIRNSTFFMRK